MGSKFTRFLWNKLQLLQKNLDNTPRVCNEHWRDDLTFHAQMRSSRRVLMDVSFSVLSSFDVASRSNASRDVWCRLISVYLSHPSTLSFSNFCAHPLNAIVSHFFYFSRHFIAFFQLAFHKFYSIVLYSFESIRLCNILNCKIFLPFFEMIFFVIFSCCLNFLLT